MSGALVRGGPGTEIALRDILPPHLRSGLATREKVEPIARDYEKCHPGAVVVCDWELFDDEDIAAMAPAEQRKARADRNFLAERRRLAKQASPEPDTPRGGDPDRLREQLARNVDNMARLDPKHPRYRDLFSEYHTQINELEDALGLPRTLYQLGDRVATFGDDLPPARKAELREKVLRYRSLPYANRSESIAQGRDPILLRMIFDIEPEEKLRAAVAQKIAELELKAQQEQKAATA